MTDNIPVPTRLTEAQVELLDQIQAENNKRYRNQTIQMLIETYPKTKEKIKTLEKTNKELEAEMKRQIADKDKLISTYRGFLDRILEAEEFMRRSNEILTDVAYLTSIPSEERLKVLIKLQERLLNEKKSKSEALDNYKGIGKLVK